MQIRLENMTVAAVNKKDAIDIEKWRKIICCGDLYRKEPKEEEARSKTQPKTRGCTYNPGFYCLTVINSVLASK